MASDLSAIRRRRGRIRGELAAATAALPLLFVTACAEPPAVPAAGARVATVVSADVWADISADEDTFGIPKWDEERTIAILRVSMRRRGLPIEIFGGPMGVVPTPDHPDAAEAIEGEEAGALAAAWPQGASLVVTVGGRWWVWDYGSTAAADATARGLMAQVGSRGS